MVWTVNAVIHQFQLGARPRIHQLARAVDKLWTSVRGGRRPGPRRTLSRPSRTSRPWAARRSSPASAAPSSGRRAPATSRPGRRRAPRPTTHPAAGFTKEFLRAAIEQMSVIREWRSTLIGAVQRGFPVTEDWMRTFSDRAQHDLRLVSVAASTQSDMNALQLLNNEFSNMKILSDRFVEANKSRTYTPTDALDKDPLNGKILNCGRSLAAMAASGQFVDDGSCQ